MGGAGNDSLVGSDGDDLLYGEEGADTLIGGNGVDYFIVSSPSHSGVDLFSDFKSGEDKIAFIKSNFTGLPSSLNSSDLLVGPGKKAPDNGQHLVYDTTTGELYYDSDGLANTQSIKIAVIGNSVHPSLSIVDFYLG